MDSRNDGWTARCARRARDLAFASLVCLPVAIDGNGDAGSAPAMTIAELADAVIGAHRATCAQSGGECTDACRRAMPAICSASDLLHTAEELYARSLEAGVRDPAAARDALEALSDLGGCADRSASDVDLARLIGGWRALGAEDLERERRLQVIYVLQHEARAAGRWQDVIALAEAGAADLDLARCSLTAYSIRSLEGLAGWHCERFDSSAAAYGAAVVQAERTFYRAGLAESLENQGMATLKAGEYLAAVDLLERALAHFVSLHDRRAAASAHGMLGNAYRSLGRIDEAESEYSRAIEAYHELGDGGGAARYAAQMAVIHDMRGEYALAIELGERMLADLSGSEDPGDVALLQMHLGVSCFHLARFREALDRLGQAHASFERQGDRASAISALSNLGLVDDAIGRIDEALDCYRRGLGAAREMGLKDVELALLGNIAGSYQNLGRYAEALETNEQVLAEAEDLGNAPFAALARTNLGDLYGELGQGDRAALELERAVEATRDMGNVDAEVRALSHLGKCHEKSGRLDRALECYERALDVREVTGDKLGLSNSLIDVGDVQALNGDRDRALECMNEALRLKIELGDRSGEVSAHMHLGWLLSLSSKGESAREHYEIALAEAEALGQKPLVAECSTYLADLELELQEPQAALSLSRRSLDIQSSLGAGLSDADALGLRGDVRTAADLGLLAARDLLARGEGDAQALARDAFYFSESGRALLLVQGIAHRQGVLAAHLPVELVEAEARARVQVAAAHRRLSSLDERSQAGPVLRENAREALDRAYRDLESATRRIQHEPRPAAALVSPVPISLEQAQADLHERGAFVLYSLEKEDALALVVTRRAASFIKLGDSPSLRSSVERYLGLASVAGTDDQALAGQIYDRLLAPLESALADAESLWISPDGILCRLPFEALWMRGTRALERFEISYVPSASVMSALIEDEHREPHGRGFLGVGDPLYPDEQAGASRDASSSPRDVDARGERPLKRLPASGDEVRELAALYPAEERSLLLRDAATIEELFRRLDEHAGRFDAIHFACHGRFDDLRSGLFGLALAGGEMLGTEWLCHRRIPADLTVLSACETALAPEARGEGLVGFVRSCFVAGAPRVVVANWHVSDASTRNLMLRFYRNRNQRGLSTASALREAKLSFAREGGERSHPYHWAGFVLWGLAD